MDLTTLLTRAAWCCTVAYDALAQLAAAIKGGTAVVNPDGSMNVTHAVETVTAVKALVADIEGKSVVPVPVPTAAAA